MNNSDFTVGTEITGFWFKKDYYEIAGTIVEVLQVESKRVALKIHSTAANKDIVTWVTSVELAKVGA